MTPNTKAAIKDHAAREFPRESCGVIVVSHGKEVYRPCRNIAVTADEDFTIDPADYAAAEDAGEIVAVVHSHPGGRALPSQADLVGCERSGLPWVIVGWPTGEVHEFQPSGYEAPLVGRQFVHGVLDCFSLVRDWYAREMNIHLNDYPRRDQWWVNGEDLYRQYMTQEGFIVVDDALRIGDGLLMQVGSPVPNHAAVVVGDSLILHHVQRRLSSRDVYGGYWRKSTVAHLRHSSCL